MKCTRAIWVVAILTPLAGIPATRAQEPKAPQASPGVLLRVGGDVPNPLELTAAEIGRLPRRTVRVEGHDGIESEFEGVALVELVKAAGVKFGDDLRGPALATYLLVEAADGYRVVFALPELDPASTDRIILLADRRDGKPLDVKDGPLRIVVTGEKRHSRWVRQVIALRLRRA